MIVMVRELVNEVRLLHNQLVQLGTELHRDSGITLPQRAVLEYLEYSGATTVPDIARARNVTRQHIQTIINDLDEQDLVAPQSNPAHQRSPLFALSAAGHHTITNILSREQRYLVAHLAELDSQKIRDATNTLAELRHRLRNEHQ